MKKKMRKLVIALSRSKRDQSPGNFVKTMDCCFLGDKLDIIDLSLWDKLFPLVEDIEIFASQKVLYEKLQRLIKKGKFANLKRLPFLFWDQEHTEFVLLYKERIKELRIRDVPHVDSMPYRIFEELHHFPILNSLRLNCGAEDKTLDLENLLPTNIPQLKSIDIRFSCSSSKISVDTSNLDIDNIEPLYSVRELNFDNHQLLSGGAQSFLYMMKKFPHLDKLGMLAIEEEVLKTRTYTTPTTACLSQFLVYLFSIKESCSVLPIISDQSTTRIVKDFFQYVLTQQIYRKVAIHLNISLRLVGKWEIDEYSEDRTAYIMIKNERCGDTKFCGVEVVYKVLSPDDFEPYLKLFHEIGNMDIEALNMGEQRTFDAGDAIPVSLDTIFNHFTKLKVLRIRKTTNIIISETTNSEIITQFNLEFLHFDECNLTEETLHRISGWCPELRFLKIASCTFRKSNGNQHFSETQPFVPMDLSSLWLEGLHFDVSLFVYSGDYQYHKAFIRLQTATKRTRYCKLNWIESTDTTEFEHRKDDYTEVDYEMCLKDRKCIVFDIYCEEVTTFIIEADRTKNLKRKIYLEEEEL